MARPLLVQTVRLLAVALPLSASACLYTDVRAPLSYGSATPSDANGNLGAEVKGSACNHAILWLVAFGDGGYDAAVADARGTTHAPFLVDVKSDTTYRNVLLGVYQRQCTNITARVPGTTAAAGSATPAGSAIP
ncbi:MAG: TRL domain-containing protein [Polyangiaceae bacterium]|jgi:hypothetical protein